MLPKIESIRISVTDSEILEKVKIVTPVRMTTKRPKKAKTGCVEKGSVPRNAKHVVKRRSVLEGDKYGPNGGALWKRVNARFLALYKALIAEPDKNTRVARLKRAVSETG